MLSLRPTSPADFPTIAALTNHFIQHTTIHWGTQPTSAAEMLGLWEKTRERFPWLTAELDGRFAGYAKAAVWRERAAYDRTAETGLYVALDCHRRGVGRALSLALLDELRARGFHAAVAGIALPNDASVAMHEAVGYRHVGTFREVGFKFDQWLDAGFWQVTL
jgi:phosphinothricin acetyltransferase